MLTIERAKKILKNAKDAPVLACGDVMLDAYLTGPVERFSQEAPVPVIAVEDEQFFPGGAGNAANCMAAIGLTPHLVGVIGEKGRIRYTEVMEEEYKNQLNEELKAINKDAETIKELYKLRTNLENIGSVE